MSSVDTEFNFGSVFFEILFFFKRIHDLNLIKCSIIIDYIFSQVFSDGILFI